jgi:preprotein translocase subunit SecA
MDYLREGIHLRGFAQIEPIVAYKNEAFTLFQDLMHTIWSDFARMVYNVEVEIEGQNGVPQHDQRLASRQPSLEYSGGTAEDQPSVYGEGGEAVAAGRGPAAAGRRQRAARPQRPVLVRVGQEVQEVPRRQRLSGRRGTPER